MLKTLFTFCHSDNSKFFIIFFSIPYAREIKPSSMNTSQSRKKCNYLKGDKNCVRLGAAIYLNAAALVVYPGIVAFV